MEKVPGSSADKSIPAFPNSSGVRVYNPLFAILIFARLEKESMRRDDFKGVDLPAGLSDRIFGLSSPRNRGRKNLWFPPPAFWAL